ERRAGRDEHRERALLPATCAPKTLPQRGDAPRVPSAHHGIERADVDTQLECVGGHHAADQALAPTPFDTTPGLGQVYTAIADDLLRIDFVAGQAVAQVLEHGLDLLTPLAKHQGGHLGPHQVSRDTHRRLQVALADAE